MLLHVLDQGRGISTSAHGQLGECLQNSKQVLQVHPSACRDGPQQNACWPTSTYVLCDCLLYNLLRTQRSCELCPAPTCPNVVEAKHPVCLCGSLGSTMQSILQQRRGLWWLLCFSPVNCGGCCAFLGAICECQQKQQRCRLCSSESPRVTTKTQELNQLGQLCEFR